MPTAELKSIRDLFELNFYVPSYQRGYKWTDTQINELLEDLYDFARERTNDYYCLQPVIVKQRCDCEKSWELVDGQQRLTVLWLISVLYYCSNKEDVVGLKQKVYTLEYAGKDNFTDVFKEISKLAEDHPMTKLRESLAEFQGIDVENLRKSIDCIVKFERDNKTPKGVLSKIFRANASIKVKEN